MCHPIFVPPDPRDVRLHLYLCNYFRGPLVHGDSWCPTEYTVCVRCHSSLPTHAPSCSPAATHSALLLVLQPCHPPTINTFPPMASESLTSSSIVFYCSTHPNCLFGHCQCYKITEEYDEGASGHPSESQLWEAVNAYAILLYPLMHPKVSTEWVPQEGRHPRHSPWPRC